MPVQELPHGVQNVHYLRWLKENYDYYSRTDIKLPGERRDKGIGLLGLNQSINDWNRTKGKERGLIPIDANVDKDKNGTISDIEARSKAFKDAYLYPISNFHQSWILDDPSFVGPKDLDKGIIQGKGE